MEENIQIFIVTFVKKLGVKQRAKKISEGAMSP